MQSETSAVAQFATAADGVDRLALAHSAGMMHDELRRLGRYPLVVVDEVGYIPSTPRSPTCSSSWCPPDTTGRR